MRLEGLALAAVVIIAAAATQAGETLRIGVTDDYRPFTYRVDGGARRGIDVDLAHAIGAALDREIQFVQTSWPTLLADLAADRYDLAMSGISRNPVRAEAGLLSQTYLVTGKTALARCAFAATVTSLAAIDRPEVAVIVNPGGTNEVFARGRLQNARLVVHGDNLSVFDALAGGAADLMITDKVEAQLVAADYPGELCVPLDTPFDRVEKIVLVKRDAHLHREIDAAITSMVRDGRLDAIIRSHLPSRERDRPAATPSASD